MHPKEERTLRILTQPLRRPRDDLIRGALNQRAIFVLNRLEAGIINIEAAIETGGETVSGIQLDGAHKGRRAVTASVKQIRKIGKFSRQRSAQLAGAMSLRVGACEDGSLRNHGERGL